MSFRRDFDPDRAGPVLAIFSLVALCLLLKKSYRVSQMLRNPDSLPLLVSKVENPKTEVGPQESAVGPRSNGFYGRAMDREGTIRISPDRHGGGAPPSAGDQRAVDLIVSSIVDENSEGPGPEKKQRRSPAPETQSSGGESGNGHRVQLIALRSSQQAAIYVHRIRKLYGDLLKNLDVFVSELNLGERGIFYRVQIGKFGTREAASGFCENLLRRNSDGSISCLVVR
ncbi:MAG: SPOR domain-containing protein [Rickettsiales bacterium]|jgi:hypothetical protein|nr:SPOR domain-containing protein [Rickettsiales bacterium]